LIKKLALIVTLASVILTTLFGASACQQQQKTQLNLIIAGSLMMPFQALTEEFEKENPNIDVTVEGHGSIQVIRQITELGRQADVIAVADFSLIPMMMYGIKVPNTNENYANWYVKFARNYLVVAYMPQSKYADEINNTNWYDVLSRPDVRIGISDPQYDSCGYRTLMMLQLAELYYDNETIFEDVLGNFSPPITVTENNGKYTISLPEIIGPEKRIRLRDSSVKLLSLMETGDIDYAFMYKSEAEQWGLEFLELPSEINLGSNEYEHLAQEIRVKLSYQRFATVNPEFLCEPIQYSMTIPQNAPHTEEAIKFIEFAIGPKGQGILQNNHLPLIIPAKTDTLDKLPNALKSLVELEE